MKGLIWLAPASNVLFHLSAQLQKILLSSTLKREWIKLLHQSLMVARKTMLFSWLQEGCLFILDRDNQLRSSVHITVPQKQLQQSSPVEAVPGPSLSFFFAHSTKQGGSCSRVLLSHSTSHSALLPTCPQARAPGLTSGSSCSAGDASHMFRGWLALRRRLLGNRDSKTAAVA